MSGTAVRRDRTAIKRYSISRPLQLAMDSGLLVDGNTFFDYGCGRGDDVRLLRKKGFEASGWDPAYRKEAHQVDADIVNLGYVLNVIEEPAERAETLKKAWALARGALLVSVRMYAEIRSGKFREYGDGYMSERDTFQKFYTQAELRSWTTDQLGVESVPIAPGIVIAFKNDLLRHSFLASRFRRPTRPRGPRRSDVLFEQHQDLLDPLMQFLRGYGRLPVDGELEETSEINSAFGSLKKAFGVIRNVTDKDEWSQIAEECRQDLLVFLALDRFGGRPRFSQLPDRLQADVKAFFGAYSRGCRAADELLFAAGSAAAVDHTCRMVEVGKMTRDALYVHTSAISHLPPLLRVFEGCARAFIGDVEGANVVKLERSRPRVSYLAYAHFDKDPHPSLESSLQVKLDSLSAGFRSYRDSTNPPIFHRKELVVSTEYSGRKKFERLTLQEEKWGLFDGAPAIGNKAEWDKWLEVKGVRLRGHRLVRRRPHKRGSTS